MNENLPVHVNEIQSDGVITYANEVIAIIAGMAVNEVDGVASMINTNAIADLFNRGKPITRGVKVEVGVEEASVDLVLTVEYGKPIQKVCVEVQESVRKAIETMTGLHVVKVDVHVMGVSFERETKEIAQGYVNATKAQKAIEENKTSAVSDASDETMLFEREKEAEEDDFLIEDDFFVEAADDEDEVTEETDELTNGNSAENADLPDPFHSSAQDEESDEALKG